MMTVKKRIPGLRINGKRGFKVFLLANISGLDVIMVLSWK